MAGERYAHIFLKGPINSQGFTNPQKGGSNPRIPHRDPLQHSNYLKGQLNSAWEKAEEQRKAVVHVDRQGVYVDFIGEPGNELIIKSLEDMRKGIRLLNVRYENEHENDQKKTLATVYIPNEKRGHFLNKLNSYDNETTPIGNRRNEKLINSISDIKLSVLESFWQDDVGLLPGDDPAWVEVWLRNTDVKIDDNFDTILGQHQITKAEGAISFPERTVIMIFADRSQLQLLIKTSDDIAEFRLAKEVATFFIELDNKDQVEWTQELLARTEINNESIVSVCVLDSGVNKGHTLLNPVLFDEDLHSVKPEWGLSDDGGHGTLMAGTAAYGDLLEALTTGKNIKILHRLESAKILPPPPEENPKQLWGYITAQGLYHAEIQKPEYKRIVCLSVTSTDSRDRGRPSSWSGKLDELASGAKGDHQRLFILCAGNIESSESWKNYFTDNITNEIHDPGQAWNALTVGAYTEKVNIVDPTLENYEPIAPCGGLSPYSTTSCNWPSRKWPIKPEILFEGGNIARGPNDSIFDTEDLKLLSTHYDITRAQFAPFCATSASSALASWMAAQIQVAYPDAWPETIRALIVHTAQWTDTMKDQFLADQNKASYERLLRICGYGVPDLDRALYCAANSLTLISQTDMQPYDKRDGRYISRDMHLYALPWPSDVLLELAETQVEMRVTLSYFVEPGPGEVGWQDRYRYPSHLLRFEVNGPGESEDEFIQRINQQARDEGGHPGTTGPGDRWTIGKARDVGSIHSDIWQGTAAQLSQSNHVAVYPGVGWWRERNHLGKWDKRCRYSLIVSIHTPTENVDIYTPVAVQVGVAGIPIEITT